MEFQKLPSSPRTPDGYRLVTLRETINNFDNLKSRGILNDANTLRVLDGITRGGSQVDISEWQDAKKNRSEQNMLVLGRFPTEVPRKGSGVFRKELYSKITLDDVNKEDTLRLSLLVGDIEVIYCLRYSTSQPNLESLIEERKAQFEDPGFSLIVRMLLDSPGTPDEKELDEKEVKDILSYALKTRLESGPAMDVDYAVAVVEIVSNKCKMNVVVSAIDQVDTLLTRPPWEAKRTGMLTKLWEAKLIGMLTTLLSASTNTLAERIPIIEGRFEKILTEAVHRGYVFLVEGLLDMRENIKGQLVRDVDDDGKTLLHYAAEWQSTDHFIQLQRMHFENVCERLFIAYKDSFGLDFVKKLDKHGTSVLHLASFSGRAIFCKILVAEYELQVNAEDYWQQNLLHYAAKGDYGERIVDAFSESFANLVHKKNKKGETPLHVAAIYGNIEMVKEVIVCLSDKGSVKTALKDVDYGGRTPLHLAAREGHAEMVKELLTYGSDPLEERDDGGKTALHYAAMSIINASESVKTLLGHCKSEKEQALLLWVSAARIGTADEIEGLDSNIKRYLKQLKEARKHVNVLKAAACANNPRLTWELLNRGADIGQLPDNAEFSWVRNQVGKLSVQGTDQPTLQDTLVSISGGNGMGKTSLLKLIKAQLLTTAAQLAFPFFSEYEDFGGARKMSLSPTGEIMCQKICQGIAKLIPKGEGSLVYFLEKYRPEHEAVYRSLACMDVDQLLEANERDSKNPGQSMGEVPRVLTVDFNVGNCRGAQEAWAGLAVEITKQIEASMSRAQRFSTRWRNARRRNSESFYLKFLLPGLLLTFLAVWIAWAAWKFLQSISHRGLQNLQYGSIPVTVITIVWAAMKALMSVFKPVSQQMSGYFSLTDYSKNLGYQYKVISDVIFLKEEIGKKPYFICSFIAGEKCKNWFGLWEDNIEQTSVPKYSSAPAAKLRIIAFVDDLHRCEDGAMLRVLWAIDQVFKVCEIDVILAMNRNVIKAVYKRSSHDQDEDLVDNFISKIKLPVDLPDPDDDEWKSFLQSELGREPQLRESTEPDTRVEGNSEEGKPYFHDVSRAVEEEREGENKSGEETCDKTDRDMERGTFTRNFEGCIPFSCGWLRKREQGISSFWQKVQNWLKCVIHILYILACHVISQPNPPFDDKSKYMVATPPLVRRARELRETVTFSYSDHEVQTFEAMTEVSSDNLKFPREWKRYLTYYNFARNVASKRARKGIINYPAYWETEFAVWTFACWQWEGEMNILIKDWNDYACIKEDGEQPSLKDIVSNYIEQRWPHWQPQTGGREIEESILVKKALDTIYNMSVKGVQGFKELSFKGNMSHVPKDDRSQLLLSIQGKGYSPLEISNIIKEDQKEQERWNNLTEALATVKDVSMQGIQCFQQFRFHCLPKDLSLAEKS
uniref:TSA: Wollemia nobilis Ref_Wollemi_Transcript_12549_4809 transcribed RNA sequence n=1 Tax=Wollemia nobilis TaxID=56998 RepID=A0A0C9RUF4_9CONI